MSRLVSSSSIPTFALNHCRSSSMSETTAIGLPVIRAASWVSSSKEASQAVSSTS
jgi:hypothetical protein